MPPTRHRKIKKIIDSVALSFGALFLGLALWVTIGLLRMPRAERPKILFPLQEHVQVQLEGTFSFNEKQYEVLANWLAVPRRLEEGAALSLRWDKVEVKDKRGIIWTAFRRDPFQIVHYGADPRLPPETRAEIFRALDLDLSHQDFSQDQSIFQQRLNLYITDRGGIGEIAFNAVSRNQVLRLLQRTSLAALLRSLVDFPHRLPPLFSNETSMELWETEGDFLEHLRLYHEAAVGGGALVEVDSWSQRSGKKNPLPIPGRDWLERQGRKIALNEWKLHWVYDRENEFLQELEINGQLLLEQDFLKVHREDSIGVQAKISFKPVPIAPTLHEIESYDTH